jgi:aryl-alcohol dehydrogenase-like predicted oxidoreductase
MDRRAFGNTGLHVSVIGFGAAPIGFLETEQQRVGRLLNHLLDSGVNLIDTAAAYPGSEEAIGKAVSHRRDEFVLISKCGQEFEDLEGEAWSPRVIRQTIDRSLQRLRTDHLDVMLLHSCDLAVLQKGDAFAALVEARDAGKIRFAGYSGDNEAAEFAVALDDMAVLETSVNICDQANLNSVLPAARRRGVGVIAKRPIANAAWKQLAEQPGMYREYAETYTRRLSQMEISPADLGLTAPEPPEWSEVAMRFVLSEPGVHTAIIGTTNPDHALSNLRAAERGPLPEEAVRKLRSAFKTAEERSGTAWTAQT